MKALIARWTLIAVTLSMTVYLCLMGQHEHRWLGISPGFGGLLLWPGVLLSLTGALYTWVLVPLLGIVIVTLAVRMTKHRHWITAPVLGVALGIAYLASGAVVFAILPVRLPEPPDRYEVEKRAQYLSAYEAGYRTGVGGVLRTYCFSPEAETQGFYDGMHRGLIVYHHAMGIRIEDQYPGLIHVAAGRDGVTINTDTNTSNKTPNQTPSSVGSRLE